MRVGHRRWGRHGWRSVSAAISVVAVMLVCAAPALADAYPAGDKVPARVLGESFFQGDPPAAVRAASVQAASGPSGALAFSGTNVLIVLAVAAAAIVLGVVLWRAGRRPPNPSIR